MSDEKPAFVSSNGFGKHEWPLYIANFRRDEYNRVVSRGFTPEEVHRLIDRGQWKAGSFHLPVQKAEG
jgi:hypothetical protein